MKIKLILFFIIVVSMILRLWKFTLVPNGFFCDEASVGYNAYTILQKGTDEYGNKFPLFFTAFGEYKNPVQIYSTVPFVFLFGMNEASIRLTSAIYGSLGILAIFFLSQEIFFAFKLQNAKICSLISAFLLSISPWHIHFSRVSLEGLTAFTFFTTTASFLFLKFIRTKKNKFLYFSSVFFAIASYSYFPARIFIPPFLFLTSIVFLNKKNLPKFIISLAIFALLSLPMVFHLFVGNGFSRFRQVSIFSQPLTPKEKIVHILNNYLGHFSFGFLFSKGDIDYSGQFITRHSVRGMGELYLWQLPLIIIGIIYLLTKLKDKNYRQITFVLFAWLLIYPTGSALTQDAGPQATRSIIGVVPFQLLTAVGIAALFSFSQKMVKSKLITPVIIAILGIAVTFSFAKYLKLYFKEYPLYSSDYWGWQSGPKEIISYFGQQQNKYDDLFMTGSFNAPYVFLKFYSPDNCQNCKIGGIDKVDKKQKQLFALRPEEITIDKTQINIIKSIHYPNNKIAYVIFEMNEK